MPKKGSVTRVIEHRPASNISSHYVSGVIVASSGDDANNDPDHGVLQFIFYEEAVAITQEHIETNRNDNTITATVREQDLAGYREDKVRISMTNATARALYTVLKVRYQSDNKVT